MTTLQLVRYSRVRANLPAGMVVAGVPVGGLDRQQAAQRLLEAYSIPVEILYNNSVIHLSPSVVDFQLDLDSMLAAADLERTRGQFWLGFRCQGVGLAICQRIIHDHGGTIELTNKTKGGARVVICLPQ